MMELTNGILLPNNKTVMKKINSIIDKYNLSISYDRKNEKIFRDEQIFLLVTKKYILLRLVSENSFLQKDLVKMLSEG